MKRLLPRWTAAACAAALAVIGIPGPEAAADPATSYVRVDQVGYQPGAADQAYLMSTADMSGARFQVVDSAGRTAFRGRAGDRARIWSHSGTVRYRVYPLNFRLRHRGVFRIVVSGAAPATSTRFSVASTRSLYETLLGNTLFYYRSVRDGPQFVRGPLSPAPAHLNDRRATTYFNPPIQTSDDELITTTGTPLLPYGTTIDASGGHWDAGDNMKYVETESYETALMQLGVRDFPRQLGARARTVAARAGRITPDFRAEAAFGMDFLSRMWDDKRRVLYFQVGNTQGWQNFPGLRADYDFWRLPQADDTAPDSPPGDPGGDYSFIRHRPVFVAGPPGSTKDPAGRPISPNLAGRLAADFAIYYQLHHRTNPRRAAQALRSAQHILAQADLSYSDPATGDRRLLTIIPYDGYPETVWDDDMAFGATEVYLALRMAGRPAGRYLRQAARFTERYNALPAQDRGSLNLYDVGSLANFELYRALGATHERVPISRADLREAVTAQVRQAAAVASADAFGFGRDWQAGDTTSEGDGLSVVASMAGDLNRTRGFDTLSRRWTGNMLGANPWGVSLIIGAGDVWTRCPQQQPANLLGSLTGGAPELWGAAVEGPTSEAASGGYDTMRACPPGGGDRYARFNGNNGHFAADRTAVYKDNVESYTTTEPAIDLTATSFLMFAWQQAGAPKPLSIRR